jgi:small-conductance mechanosensitive channel
LRPRERRNASKSLIVKDFTHFANAVPSTKIKIAARNFGKNMPSCVSSVVKVSSYLIMVITVMAAVAELKIASQFISTLFTGFVYTLTLGLGLAFGLGSKDVVSDFMQEWYQTTKKELK